jgi:hypothetical protein
MSFNDLLLPAFIFLGILMILAWIIIAVGAGTISLRDVLILVLYILGVISVFVRMFAAFNDEVTVKLDEDALKQALEAQNLQDILGISVKFDKQYEFDKLKQLAISISNKSKTDSIAVDWDYCVLTDLDGRSRRVTRLMPGTTLDLFQEQVISTIAPSTTLKENITAEDTLNRKAPEDKGQSVALEMEIAKPLVNLAAPDDKAPDAAKRRYARFMDEQIPLEFFLSLAFRIFGPGRSREGDRVRILCRFVIKKLPWKAGLPWNPR